MLSKMLIVPPGVGLVLLAFLHLVSGKASTSVQDAVTSFTPLTGFERFVDEHAVPEFANDIGFSQPFSSTLGFLNHSAQCQPASEIDALFDNGFDGTSTVSLVIAFVAMGLLMTNTHFSRPVCAVVSHGFWLAVLWIGVMLSPMVGVALAVVAFWKRGSWLLFMQNESNGAAASADLPDPSIAVKHCLEGKWRDVLEVVPEIDRKGVA